jgi:hypothetical protein
MFKSVAMRFLRGLIAAVLGAVVAYLTTNIGEVVNVVGLPVSLAPIVMSVVSAALLAIDKWVRNLNAK